MFTLINTSPKHCLKYPALYSALNAEETPLETVHIFIWNNMAKLSPASRLQIQIYIFF
jgi:hypothetical protein